jgi:hypothetical protein
MATKCVVHHALIGVKMKNKDGKLLSPFHLLPLTLRTRASHEFWPCPLKHGDHASQVQLQGSFTIGLCVSDALRSLKDSPFSIFGTFLESFSLQALNLPERRLRKGRELDFLIFLGI